ncbi:MAG: alpha/beta hydrolase [Polyangiaceae bacterium]
MLRPFEAVPFDQLPDRPRLPHGFARTRRYDHRLKSAHFGDHDVRIHELGSGPPLLLVHGLMTTAYSFRYVFEPLAEHFRVVAPDLPGAGASEKPDVDYSARHMAEWIYELCRSLGILGAACIGNSMGGYVCMRAALAHPDAFRCLVNEHSPGVPELRLHALHGVLGIPGSLRLLSALVQRNPERFVHRNVHYFDESLKSREEARVYAEPLRSEAGRRAFHRHLAHTMSPSGMREFVDELEVRRDAGRGFGVPLQLIYARRDPMVPPRIGKELAALLPGANLIWLEEGSHFAHIDRPQAFLSAVLPFLLEHGA